MNIKRELLRALQELHAVVPYLKERRACPGGGWQKFSHRRGICGNVHGYVVRRNVGTLDTINTRDFMSLLDDLFVFWPGAHCASRAYPVGGVTEYQVAEMAHTLWHNPKRVELLEWLIATLTEELSNEPVQSWSPTP